jgi:hypothetical protein
MELAETLAKEYAEGALKREGFVDLETWVVMDQRTLSMPYDDACRLAKEVEKIFKSRLIITID